MELIRRHDRRVWVIAPLQKNHTGIEARRNTKAWVQDNNAQQVFIDIVSDREINVRAITKSLDSSNEYFDIAHAIKSHQPNDNVIYIENVSHHYPTSDSEQFLLVVIYKGQVYLDVILSMTDLYSDLDVMLNQFVAESKDTIQTEFCLSQYGIDFTLPEALHEMVDGEPVTLSNPLSETITPTETHQYKDAKGIGRLLSRKGLSQRWVPVLTAVFVGIALTFYLGERDEQIETKTVVVDPFQQYDYLMLNGLPQASNLFAQSYNNLAAFNEHLTGWSAVKLTVSKQQDFVYRLANVGGSEQALMRKVDALGEALNTPMVTDDSEAGKIIAVYGAKVPVFSLDGDKKVPTWNLQRLNAKVKDQIRSLVPEATIHFEHYEQKDPSQSQWRTMRLRITLDNAFIDDLLKLASITRGLPISSVSQNLDTIGGRLNGDIFIDLHGTDSW
jgi:hypothetical protein